VQNTYDSGQHFYSAANLHADIIKCALHL
jgi:hypothetical protein